MNCKTCWFFCRSSVMCCPRENWHNFWEIEQERRQNLVIGLCHEIEKTWQYFCMLSLLGEVVSLYYSNPNIWIFIHWKWSRIAGRFSLGNEKRRVKTHKRRNSFLTSLNVILLMLLKVENQIIMQFQSLNVF